MQHTGRRLFSRLSPVNITRASHNTSRATAWPDRLTAAVHMPWTDAASRNISRISSQIFIKQMQPAARSTGAGAPAAALYLPSSCARSNQAGAGPVAITSWPRCRRFSVSTLCRGRQGCTGALCEPAGKAGRRPMEPLLPHQQQGPVCSAECGRKPSASMAPAATAQPLPPAPAPVSPATVGCC